MYIAEVLLEPRLTCMTSTGQPILGTSLWFGKMSQKAGHFFQPGFSTRMPEQKGACSTTPASVGSCAAR